MLDIPSVQFGGKVLLELFNIRMYACCIYIVFGRVDNTLVTERSEATEVPIVLSKDKCMTSMPIGAYAVA